MRASRRKCLGKMEDVGHQGRTVLFVSHNMPAITRLCPRVILLSAGRVLEDGPSTHVVGAYLQSGLGTTAVREWERGDAQRPVGDYAGLLAVRVRSRNGTVTEAADIRCPVRVEVEWDLWETGHTLMPHIQLTNEEGVIAFSAHDLDPQWRGRLRPAGRYVSTAWIPGNLLAEGTMFVTVGLVTLDPVIDQFLERDVVAFQVVDSLDGDSARGDIAEHMEGVLRPMLQWTTEFFEESGAVASGGAPTPG